MQEMNLVDRGALAYKPGDSICGWRVLANDLGVGSSGEVYRVVNETSRAGLKAGFVGAMKIFVERPDWSASKSVSAYNRFKREIEVLRDLNRQELKVSFFPKYYEDGEINGHPFYVMEELSKFELPNTDRGVAVFLEDVCKAVETLHKKRYVHRDIKPSNILRRGDGSYVLIDLGLVKRISESGTTTQPSLSIVDGRVLGVGTAGYAAPEQFYEAKATVASDIHALGMIINECFSNVTMTDAWRNIVTRSTSSVADMRYASIADLRKAIKDRGKFISDEVRASKEYKSAQRWKRLERWRTLLGVIGSLVAIIGAGGLYRLFCWLLDK